MPKPTQGLSQAEQELLARKDEMDNPVVDMELGRDQMLAQLHGWSMGFIRESSQWRKSSYEQQWRRWQRNADSNYDPELAKKKEKWQSKAFWPITPSHKESAQSMLYKTEMGPQPPIEVQADDGIPVDMDQSKNIRDVILVGS